MRGFGWILWKDGRRLMYHKGDTVDDTLLKIACGRYGKNACARYKDDKCAIKAGL